MEQTELIYNATFLSPHDSSIKLDVNNKVNEQISKWNKLNC